MKQIFTLFFLLFYAATALATALAEGAFSIAFVHIGKQIPSHIEYSIKQARHFNPDCPIYLLLSEEALPVYKETLESRLKKSHITLVNMAKLPPSRVHRAYKSCCAKKFDMAIKEGFWSHTSERFFYLYDFMKKYEITNLFHLENDVMLYEDLSTIMPAMSQLQCQMAIPFQYKTNCVASLVFFKKPRAVKSLNDHIFEQVSTYKGSEPAADISDMRTLASYHEKHGNVAITPLPIIMPEYETLYGIRKTTLEHGKTKLQFLYQHANLFCERLFDAAAFGIYLDGYDPILNSIGPGAIHYRALFDPSKFSFFWAYNENGKKVPCLKCRGKTYNIINLHIHSKHLEKYTSYDHFFLTPFELLDPQERGFIPMERG